MPQVAKRESCPGRRHPSRRDDLHREPVTLRRLAKYIGLWAALNFAFHLVWESAHVRLYTIWDSADRLYVAWAVFHCTLGDVLIALAGFGAASFLTRSAGWPLFRPFHGTPAVIASTVAYTVWSEWYNVYRIGSWEYGSSMPTIAGIGLTPILQWIVVPPLGVLAFRALCRPASGATA
jgi:hypothetical protein